VISQFISPLVAIWILSGYIGNRFILMNRKEIVSYYLYTSLLYLFLNSSIDEMVKNCIQDGQMATYLLKPLSFVKVAFIRDLSTRVMKLSLGLPIFFLLLILSWREINIPLGLSLFLLPLMTLISFSLSFLISFTLGLSCLWLEEIWGLQNLKYVSIIVFGGVALPYQIFPVSLQRLLYWTPFPYLVNWPLRLGMSGSYFKEIIIAGIWLLFFLVLSRLVWRAGLKRYSAMGVA